MAAVPHSVIRRFTVTTHAMPIHGMIHDQGRVGQFITQTKLEMISDGGDLSFSGEIQEYSTKPAAIRGDETASLTRLTIVIKVTFVNEKDPDKNFESTFRHYEDFDADQSLDQVEEELIPQILEKIIEDIFNRAVVNW